MCGFKPVNDDSGLSPLNVRFESFFSSTSNPRPYITAAFRRPVFDALYRLSHPGAKATTKLVAQRFIWPGIRRNCRQWAKQCTDCQRNKTSRHTFSPISTFSSPSEQFSHVHMDIVGPLPIYSGYRYCLTVIDRLHVGLKHFHY